MLRAKSTVLAGGFIVRFALLITVIPLIFISEGYGRTQQTGSNRTDRVLGIQFYNQQQYQPAVESLAKAVRENKADYEAWYYLGLSQTRTKDLKEATTSFEAAIKLQPNRAAAHSALAYVLLLRNKLTPAFAEARLTLSLDSAVADAHYVLGVVQLRTGHHSDALAEAETTLKLNPDVAVAYLLKSQALVKSVAAILADDNDQTKDERTNRYREAAAALDEYLRRVPNGPLRETWTEQLETLRLLSNDFPPDDPHRITPSKEVTTMARVLSKPEPTYTEQARQNRVSGTVVLRCVFTADGSVKHVFVVSGLPDGLTEQSIVAAKKIKFVPALKDGKPVSMWMELQYNFSLF